MRLKYLLLISLTFACSVLCCTPAVTVALQPERAYEMVSPVYKAGFGALNIEAVSPDGENVAFYSPGTFAESPGGATALDYLAHREATGWTTITERVPVALSPEPSGFDVSSTLGTVLNLGKPGPNVEAAFQEGLKAEFRLHPSASSDISENWELAGLVLKTLAGTSIEVKYEGASADLCHLLFSSTGEFEFEPALAALLPEALNATRQVYDLNRSCNGASPSLQLVALNAAHQPISPSCKVDIGLEDYDSVAGQSAYNAIADGGKEIFFTTCIKDDAADYQLFVRLDATTTLEVSKPLEEAETCVTVPACTNAASRQPASFAGASEDGSKVFFTTTASLVGEDKDVGNDLYMATIDCPAARPECATSEKVVTSLTQVSHTPGGEAAEVQGVVRVAPDGSHVYFVAQGILTSSQNSEGAAPLKGADNLYIYDASSGSIAFVGDLCSGLEKSGTSEDLRCPNATGTDNTLWSGNEDDAQTGGRSGQFLVFSTFAQLTRDDTNTARDVYRYDAENGELERVSIGENGYEPNSNSNSGAFDAAGASIVEGHKGTNVRFQYEMNNRAITEDGSQIVFSTAEPLSPHASNGLINIYLWRETGVDGKGEVSMVSSGSSASSDGDAVISPQGQDIFFVTTQGLVPQDTDGESDIYDARVNGSVPQSAAGSEECSSDGCQGPLTNPKPLLVPSSAVQVPVENLVPLKKAISKKRAKKKKPRPTVKIKKKARKGKHASFAGNGNSKRRDANGNES